MKNPVAVVFSVERLEELDGRGAVGVIVLFLVKRTFIMSHRLHLLRTQGAVVGRQLQLPGRLR